MLVKGGTDAIAANDTRPSMDTVLATNLTSLSKFILFWRILRIYGLLTPQCYRYASVNTLRPRKKWPPFPDDIFKYIFINENVLNSVKISLKLVPRGPINNIPALVQIMAWRRPGHKPLSEAMMVSLLAHICATRPQWVNWVSIFLRNGLSPVRYQLSHSLH